MSVFTNPPKNAFTRIRFLFDLWSTLLLGNKRLLQCFDVKVEIRSQRTSYSMYSGNVLEDFCHWSGSCCTRVVVTKVRCVLVVNSRVVSPEIQVIYYWNHCHKLFFFLILGNAKVTVKGCCCFYPGQFCPVPRNSATCLLWFVTCNKNASKITQGCSEPCWDLLTCLILTYAGYVQRSLQVKISNGSILGITYF